MTTPRRLGALLAGLLAVLAAVGPGALLAPAHAGALDEPGVLKVRTVPATPGARVAADGVIAIANRNGVARLPVSKFAGLEKRFNVLETRVSADRKVTLDRVLGNPEHGVTGEPVTVGLNTQRLVRWSFVDRGGAEVPDERISMLEMKSNTGEIVRLRGDQLVKPLWVAAGRTQQTPTGLVNKELYWSVRRVVVQGADVVNRGQQVFVPEQVQDWRIGLLFYRVEVLGRDLLFGSLAGDGVQVTRPDGEVIRAPFDENGVAVLNRLPRAQYDVHVYGSGVSFTRPMSVSKDQLVEIEVISSLDIGLIVATLVLVAVSLVLVGRRHHVLRFHRRVRRRLRRGRRRDGRDRLPRGRRRAARAVGAAVVLALLGGGLVMVAGAYPAGAAEPAQAAGLVREAEQLDQPRVARRAKPVPPTFAYYYIWFQPSSWQRAKTDYPLLGRYSSDDPVIMQRHVEMAQAAGLTGFLVSWKDQSHLTSRLNRLVAIAARTDFKLGIVYQGLDFERNPLPVSQVARDLERFADTYADHEVFDAFGEPVVVITGTEEYSLRELRTATAGVRGRLHVLASAKSPEEYRRTASVMDGDAYYWSSADPRPDWYTERLRSVAAAVKEDRGLWFAPAAAGFDARLIGGEQVVEREGGETLAASLRAARASRPDAVAVISWNEFSENSHIEPSRKYAAQELETLAALLGGEVRLPEGLTEQRPGSDAGLTGWGAILALLLLLALLNLTLVVLRGRRPGPPPPRPRRLPRRPSAPSEPADPSLEPAIHRGARS